MTYAPAPMTHNHHPDPNHRYGCHNSDKPRHRVEPYFVQDGWHPDGTRLLTLHTTEWLPIACGHSYRTDDPACEGCAWSRV